MSRRRVFPIVFACLTLPALLVSMDAISYHVRYRCNGTIISSGEEREYLLHVPKTYDPTRPTPLVISMHGAALQPRDQMEVSRWNEVADEHGFLVVYPAGSGHPRVFRMEDGRDVRYISDLIDHLSASFHVDPTRIYANGLSNGGGMSFVLSCTLSNRIAAVGLVGPAMLLPSTWCKDPKPVPVIWFHGTADHYAPYEGGHDVMSPVPADTAFPSVRTSTTAWARRNQCGAAPVQSVVAPDVTRSEYTGCANEAAVAVYTIRGGGHTWPGGNPMPEWIAGRTSDGVDASREMWKFFQAHPLR